MVTFNDLLLEHGIDPGEVSLLRHQTRTLTGDTPYALWNRDRAAFERYQSTQERRPVFQKAKYWAAFVAPAKLETLFVGLYRVNRSKNGVIDWLDPLTGEAVGAGKNKVYDLYDYKRASALADQIGKVRIEWRDNERAWMQPSVRSWAQYASRNSKLVLNPPAASSARSPRLASNRHSELASLLGDLGFEEQHATKKVTLHVRGEINVYLKRIEQRLPVVIHPWYETAYDQLASIKGVTFETPRKYYVSSNLSRFPVYATEERAGRSRYGLACDIADGRTLAALVSALEENTRIYTPDGDVSIGDVRETERQESRLARICQGAFRCSLNRIWGGRCAVTGAAQPELLRAAHIVPWSRATHAERRDPFNGLLLGAHLDALFDRHLISFDDDGRLRFASRLNASVLALIGIDKDSARLTHVDAQHRPYLARHRAQVI